MYLHMQTLLLSSVVLSALAGCGQLSPSSNTDKHLEIDHREYSVKAPMLESSQFDFGPVVGTPGSTVRHIYLLRNTSDEPIQIARVNNMKPCCGEVSIASNTIPPRESVELVVIVHVNEVKGQVTHWATVETDPPSPVPIEFRTSVTAYPALSLEPEEPSTKKTLPGIGIVRSFRLTAYGTLDKPPPTLGELDIEGALPAKWDGPATETTLENKLVRHERTLNVCIKGDAEPGHHAEEVRVKLGDNIQVRSDVLWEVVPIIVANPSGIVADGDRLSVRTLMIRSMDKKAFTIKSITSDLDSVKLPTVPSDMAAFHNLQITIRPVPAEKGRAGKITVKTDHADNHNIQIAVYIGQSRLGDNQGGR
jgi:hypothetical protein